MGWIPAQSTLKPGEQVWLPASLVALNYYRSVENEPRHFPVMLPGIAAGKTMRGALEAATLEILERDATNLWWMGGLPSHRLRLSPSLASEIASTDPSLFEWEALLLSTYDAGFPVYVVAFVLRDLRDKTMQVGFASRRSLPAAVRKAAAEAWQLRRLNRAVANPDSWIWKRNWSDPLDLVQ